MKLEPIYKICNLLWMFAALLFFFTGLATGEHRNLIAATVAVLFAIEVKLKW